MKVGGVPIRFGLLQISVMPLIHSLVHFSLQTTESIPAMLKYGPPFANVDRRVDGT